MYTYLPVKHLKRIHVVKVFNITDIFKLFKLQLSVKRNAVIDFSLKCWEFIVQPLTKRYSDFSKVVFIQNILRKFVQGPPR